MSDALNKHESKYFNTACLMDEALLCLLGKRDYRFITVKEICQKAGVNRSTFYLHYETMDDLLNETLEGLTKKFEAKFEKKFCGKPKPLNDLVLIKPEYILPYLEFLKEYKKVYMAWMSQSKTFGLDSYFGNVYSEIIMPVLEKMGVPEKERKYVIAFYVSGLHNIAFTWVKNGCVEPAEFICDVMMRYALSGSDVLKK